MYVHTPKSINFAHRLLILVGASAVFLLLASPVVHAITRGYKSDDKAVRPGQIVALSQGSDANNPKVERASRDNVDRIIGVATTVNDSLVTLASGEQEVFVETSGEVGVFVTNLNGDVKQGDLLTISPIKGILMKADGVLPNIAIALQDFTRDSADTYTIDEDGDPKDVLVQKIQANLDQKALAAQDSIDDSSLAKLGRSIVGRDIGEIRVIIALVVFFIVLIAEGGIIYGAVSSAITSLGRNPLARDIIRHELVRVILVALMVLMLGVAAIYAILWI